MCDLPFAHKRPDGEVVYDWSAYPAAALLANSMFCIGLVSFMIASMSMTSYVIDGFIPTLRMVERIARISFEHVGHQGVDGAAARLHSRFLEAFRARGT